MNVKNEDGDLTVFAFKKKLYRERNVAIVSVCKNEYWFLEGNGRNVFICTTKVTIK